MNGGRKNERKVGRMRDGYSTCAMLSVILELNVTKAVEEYL
jgi:hypothetical protein